MLLLAYAVGAGLVALWLHSFFTPSRTVANLGLAAYKPPPATVIDYGRPSRVLAQGQLPAQPQAGAEQPPAPPAIETKPPQSLPERVIDVKAPPRPKSPVAPRQRSNPLKGYAAARFGNSAPAAVPHYHAAGAYQGYLADRLP